MGHGAWARISCATRASRLAASALDLARLALAWHSGQHLLQLALDVRQLGLPRDGFGGRRLGYARRAFSNADWPVVHAWSRGSALGRWITDGRIPSPHEDRLAGGAA